MKKLIVLLLFCLFIYIVYHDVTKGTLPTAAQPKHIYTEPTKTNKAINYQMVEVKAGDTLLSIVEREQGGALRVPIEQLIKDFETLNPSVKANALQIGKTYKFPVYKRN
ncbi:LysM peptidoglycan-binding domain-containing protein [Anoxybacteroides tepidamans]|uniref:LysM peptidoglycan-binding domain-containing protein n=1 Tax=Anoxybacteroides tepidamans TaxID=265948 RepID=UPI00047F7D38|nr:LysM peptidoglycan-binding domain-containing protein [Anoxybacillus tepidamans]